MWALRLASEMYAFSLVVDSGILTCDRSIVIVVLAFGKEESHV